jgi:asparagine synthetase B (glutamine-hydrolysing)
MAQDVTCASLASSVCEYESHCLGSSRTRSSPARSVARLLVRSQARRLRTVALKAPHHGLTASMESRARRARPQLRHPPYATAHARNIYQGVRSKSHRLQFEAEGKVGSRCGLERVTPFLDRDVIAFLMSIPGDVQTRGGVPRALLRDAMRGIVPDAILRRRWPDEGTTAEAHDRIDRQAYLAMHVDLTASRAMGFSTSMSPRDDRTLELIGLEFWSRMFFSGRLDPHRAAVFQRGGDT